MYLGTLLLLPTLFILCFSLSTEKKSLLKEPYWNKNVFTSHKVRSFLDSQFTTSPYFIFAKHHFKTADFPFYAHSSVLLCSLTLRITLALFREAKPAVRDPLLNLTFGTHDTKILVPFLPSPQTPVSVDDLPVFTHRAPLGLALCIS